MSLPGAGWSAEMRNRLSSRCGRCRCPFETGAVRRRDARAALRPEPRLGCGLVERSRYRIQALDQSTWGAFASLVEANNGIFGGCWCMGFHPEDSRNEPGLNRERKLARVHASAAHAALVFDGDTWVGWCQFGVLEEVPKIKNRAQYEKGLTQSPDWRIACCFVGKGHRRQGVAAAALAGALELIAGLGGAPSRATQKALTQFRQASSSTARYRPMRSSGSPATAGSASIGGS
jgi:hypothetical protein